MPPEMIVFCPFTSIIPSPFSPMPLNVAVIMALLLLFVSKVSVVVVLCHRVGGGGGDVVALAFFNCEITFEASLSPEASPTKINIFFILL